MKKRIGNDITFTWHIYRKDGDTQVPESFTGKDVEVKLISPLQRPVTIEDITIATGVVTFTFRGKHQVTLGNYVAILQENRGEDGMVTLDVVNAVTLVPHSYMEEDGDDGDVIEAESVELESEIGQGIDAYTKAETDNLFLRKRVEQGGQYAERGLGTTMVNTIDGVGTFSTYTYAGGIILINNSKTLTLSPDAIIKSVAYGSPVSVVWADTATSQIPAATASANGLMSAADKSKLNALPTDAELTQELAGLVNTGSYNTVSKKIELKHDNTVLAEIDATAFIKDGMVSSVTINNGYLIITFNTDAGKEPISIALTDIFNPANYYTKTEIDANFPKYDEQGKVRIQTDSNNYTVISAGNISFKNPTWGNFSVNDLASMINSKASKATTLAGYGITDAKIENGVITLGSNSITPITSHQDITGKADKVSNATNGNFAALDSNGNLIDSGHKHSDYLTQHQDLSNYVQKSQTTGLLKNDGTVDTTQYLTQHQDISGKADKNEMSVVPGTGVNADKTTITLKQGTSATVLTTHQDISGKENVMPITTATGATLSAVVGNYYRLDNVGTLVITLPTITGATKLQAITFLLVCGSNAVVSFEPQGSETILYQEDFALEADTTYEVTALWNGSEWTLSRVIYE